MSALLVCVCERLESDNDCDRCDEQNNRGRNYTLNARFFLCIIDDVHLPMKDSIFEFWKDAILIQVPDDIKER